MRKHFAKPALSRFEIRLNENIALSWKYYFDNQQLTTTYHFTHVVVGSGPTQDAGCYDYYMGSLESPTSPKQGWSTTPGGDYDLWFNAQSEFKDQNSIFAMTAWLSSASNAGAYVCYGGSSGGPSH